MKKILILKIQSESQCLTQVDDYVKISHINLIENSSLSVFWDLNEQCKIVFGINASFCKVK